IYGGLARCARRAHADGRLCRRGGSIRGSRQAHEGWPWDPSRCWQSPHERRSCLSHRPRPCPRRKTTTGCPRPLQRLRAARRDRCQAPWLATITDQALSAIRTQLDESALADAWEQGRTLTVDEGVVLALESLD